MNMLYFTCNYIIVTVYSSYCNTHSTVYHVTIIKNLFYWFTLFIAVVIQHILESRVKSDFLNFIFLSTSVLLNMKIKCAIPNLCLSKTIVMVIVTCPEFCFVVQLFSIIGNYESQASVMFFNSVFNI